MLSTYSSHSVQCADGWCSQDRQTLVVLEYVSREN
jgi:hypothetical protein